jgi:hypothetical protein
MEQVTWATGKKGILEIPETLHCSELEVAMGRTLENLD